MIDPPQKEQQPMSMSKAELRIKLQALGLSAQQVADAIGKDLRTVQRYYSPASPLEPSEEVSEFIRQKWDRNIRQTNTVMEELTATVNELGDHPEAVQLTAYVNDTSINNAGHNLSQKEHDALLSQIMAQLDLAGQPYTVDYVPVED